MHGVGSTARSPWLVNEHLHRTAAIDYDEVILRWMDHYLRGQANGVETEKPVRYFVMGADQWREAAAWPPASKETSYYLDQSEALGKLVALLSAEATDTKKHSTSFVSDPAKPVVNSYARVGRARLS